MNMFIDTEFTCMPWQEGSQIISLGCCFEDDDEYFACSSEFKTDSISEFVDQNVLPYLPKLCHRKPLKEISNELAHLFQIKNVSEVWAVFPTLTQLEKLYQGNEPLDLIHTRFADWDFKLLTGLIGKLPAGFPSQCNDLTPLIRQLTPDCLPENKCPHSALEDAKWNYKVWKQWMNT